MCMHAQFKNKPSRLLIDPWFCFCKYHHSIMIVHAFPQLSYLLTPGPPAPTWIPTALKSAWSDALDAQLLDMARTLECFNKIEFDERLGYKLPRKGCLPGAILKHCFSTSDGVIAKHEPFIYKFGFTHCPHTRFYNQKFGYAHDLKAGWEHMLVLYVASETASTSFVEAALIQRYKGHPGFPICFEILPWLMLIQHHFLR